MPKPDVLVLCYHAVSEDWPSPLAVTPADLESHLNALAERGYVTATFSQAIDAPPAPRTVAVTFDDAFESVRTLALPVFEKLGMTATLFVPTGLVDQDEPMAWPGTDHWLGTPYEHELDGMGWTGVEQMRDAGWEIGSHTVSHPRLTTLGDDELAAELTKSKQEVERRLDADCPTLAYPYGDHDDRVVRAAGDAGYRFAATLPDSRERWPRIRPLGWPRVGVYPGGRFDRETSTLMRRIRASPAIGPLRAAGALRSRLRRG